MFTLTAMFLTYAYFKVKQDTAKPPEIIEAENAEMFQYEFTPPDSSKYRKIIEHVPKPSMGPNGQRIMDRSKFETWHTEACGALMSLAKEIIPKFHQIRKDVNEYAMLRKASGKLGFTGVNDETFQGAQEAMKKIMTEVAQVEREANSLRPGQPGWDAAIFQEATEEVRNQEKARVAAREERQKEREEAEERGEDYPSDDDDDKDEELWWLNPLRFEAGTRVACNMGARGFKSGIVLSDWRLPYLVQLEDGSRITAPRDHDQLIRLFDEAIVNTEEEEEVESAATPAKPKPKPPTLADGSPDNRLWRPYRFKPGQPVEMKMKDGWKTGFVTMLNWRAPKWPPGQFAAYQIKLDGAEGLYFCLWDTDEHVKKRDLSPKQLEAMRAQARAVASKDYEAHQRALQAQQAAQKQAAQQHAAAMAKAKGEDDDSIPPLESMD